MSSWLKWCKGLSRKTEVLAMADALKMSRYEVAARLADDVWAWADENVKINPDSDDVTVPVPNARAAIDALTNVAGFADAMTAAGWLTIRTGSLTFPNFARHNGRTEKDRLLDASRKKRLRQKPDKCPPDGGTPSSLLSSGVSEGNDSTETPRAKHPRNELWDEVVAQWFGGDLQEPDTPRVIKLVDGFWKRKATADELKRRIRRHKAEWPKAECSPESMLKNWARFDGRGGVARRSAASVVNPVHPPAGAVESPTVPQERINSIAAEVAAVRAKRREGVNP